MAKQHTSTGTPEASAPEEGDQPNDTVYSTEPKENFAFVANVAALRAPGSFQLAAGHELRRATVSEVVHIKASLKEFAGWKFWLIDFWESRSPFATGKVELLPETAWRYFVIAFRGSNHTIVDLQSAFWLARVELEVLFTAVDKGRTFLPEHLFRVLEDAPSDPDFFVEIGDSEIRETLAIYELLKKHDYALIDINWHINQLRQLKSLPRLSPLRFLGYFAVLESLLTHPPKSTDPYDSITRQVKKKLTLLNHRLSNPIDYRAFGASEETIWTRMYKYRSEIAHGGVPQFTGELAILKSHHSALKLLTETTKAIIRHSLVEPRLIVDLREC